MSYTRLPAHYVLHSVEAWVEGFPKEDFVTEEKESTSMLIGQEDWRKQCL